MRNIDFGYRDDTPAILNCTGEIITYSMLEKQTEQMAVLFEEKTVVMMLSDWSLETVSTYYSMLRLGVTVFLIDGESTSENIIKYCELYHPNYVWGRYEKINCIRKYLKKNVIVRGDYLLARTSFPEAEIYPPLALIMTTSGSTGEAKTVRISYRNIWDNSSAWVKRISISPEDRSITVLPMHHVFGLSILHVCWIKGASIVLYNSSVLNPAFAKTLKKLCVTMFLAVPYTLNLLEKVRFEKIVSAQIRLIVVGGAAMNNDALKKWNIIGRDCRIDLFTAYGQTEGTTYLSAGNMADCCINGCVGKPLDGLKASLDADTGELVFEGSSVSLGYAANYNDLMKKDENEGVLRTGDLAEIDSKGRIFITGRIKRFVKILGERISLDEIERILETNFTKDDFVCVGNTDLICIYHSGGEDSNSILKYLDNRLKIHKQMIRIIETDYIMRMSNGKKDYGKYKII